MRPLPTPASLSFHHHLRRYLVSSTAAHGSNLTGYPSSPGSVFCTPFHTRRFTVATMSTTTSGAARPKSTTTSSSGSGGKKKMRILMLHGKFFNHILPAGVEVHHIALNLSSQSPMHILSMNRYLQ